jgi:glyoxylase-like metal-dependent hydrolase (beta-lactamase superfamily II)
VSARLLRLESALWETTTLVLVHGHEAILIDPGVSPAEIEALRARLDDERIASVEAILATHADWDHVCGIGAFPDALSVMGPLSADMVSDGHAAQSLAEVADSNGWQWIGWPREDRICHPGIVMSISGFDIESMSLPGHTPDGVAYRLREPDVLAVGDYLSPVEYPLVEHSTAAYRATLAALLALLELDPPHVVAPGHGRLLTAEEAAAVAREDLAYLRELYRAVLGALEAGGSVEGIVERGMSVAPPRPAADGLEEGHRENVMAQIRELRRADIDV